MIRIAMIANSLTVNGISTVIYNYCKYINKESFDVVVICGTPIDEMYKEEFRSKGIRIIQLPNKKRKSLLYYINLKKELKEGKYNIVHVHGNSSSMGLELLMAYMAGVRIRIAHSHNTKCAFKAQKILYPLFAALYTDGFACGEKAGKWLFNNNFSIIQNGFQIKKFIYDDNKRAQYRKELGIKDKYVIGHIGALNYQKNHEYLIEVFEKVAEKCEDAVLLFVGDGGERNLIEEKINNSKYTDRYYYFRKTTTPELLYMVMDVFVFPSRYEGLPVVLLEAQMSGLPCIVSDTITKEIQITDLIKTKSIELPPDEWALEVLMLKKNDERENTFKMFYENFEKYDINRCVKELEEKYKTMMQRTEVTKKNGVRP